MTTHAAVVSCSHVFYIFRGPSYYCSPLPLPFTRADLISSARMINSTFNWSNQDLLGRVFLVYNRNELMLVLFPLPPQDFSCNTSHHHLMSCYPCGAPGGLHKPPASPPDQNRCVTMTNNTTYLMLEHPRFNGCKSHFMHPLQLPYFCQRFVFQESSESIELEFENRGI